MNQFDVYWISTPNPLGTVANGCERDIEANSAQEALEELQTRIQRRRLENHVEIKAYRIESHLIY
ncbi:hypothetical protein [Enterococcus sp. LJL90]